jgi:predicted O-methyltransferase YrrM
MDENTFIDIWNECCEFNIEQKPEEYRQLLELLELKCKKGAVLEIGSNYGGTTVGFCRMFNKVITIDIKHDPNFDKLKSKYSGYQYVLGDSKSNDMLEYIKSLGIKFDFIFIDGDHSYEGVKNDYEKYKQFLAHDGYMAFHDIVYSQENEANNCRVDKLWNEFDSYGLEKYMFISSAKTHSYRTDQLFYTFVNNRPYSSWGGIGVLKNTPVAVFCHNYLANGWIDIVQSQLSKLINSGLYKRADKIVYGVLPTDEMSYSAFLAMIRLRDVDKKIEIYRYSKNMYEYPTLIHLQNYCANNPNAHVLYYHAKGTSRKYDTNIESWRECLEYFNIELWRNAVNDLNIGNHDVCGALYVTWFAFLDKVFTNYYSGNFWWSSAKYINTLPNLSAKMIESKMDRDVPERWIGYGAHRWANYYNENVSSWYEHYFDPNIYRQVK